jgi:hypothetical protein
MIVLKKVETTLRIMVVDDDLKDDATRGGTLLIARRYGFQVSLILYLQTVRSALQYSTYSVERRRECESYVACRCGIRRNKI